MSSPVPTMRGLFRAAAGCLIAQTGIVPVGSVFFEYDWPVPDANLPAVNVSTPRWHNGDRSQGAGGPQYWSTLNLQVEYRIQANQRSAVIAAIDQATAQIEQALQTFIVFRPQGFGPFRRIVQSDGEMMLNSEGEKHEGGAAQTFIFEYSTDYLPVLPDYLTQVVIAVIEEFAVDDGDVNTPLREILAGANIMIPG